MPNILILDDDPQMLTSLSDVLQSSGYSVACASSGQEAIDKVQNEPDKFDLVLADVRMSGMDGLDCLSQLVGLNPKLKSVVMTGYASDDAPGRAMEVASSDYLRKPFNAEDLLQSVARVLKAGSEAKGYQLLLNKARAAAQKVGVALSGLEAVRDRAFQWYYIGIRSGLLGATAARSIWEWLESTEWERLSAEKDLDLLSNVQELKAGYEKVSYFCKTPAAITSAERNKEEALSRAEFQPFFKHIQNGLISCEQLKLAVYLRSLPPSELADAPELRELKQKIWNELKL
ncbi:response regulator [bacterium]|nr:response regulator [bacterium]